MEIYWDGCALSDPSEPGLSWVMSLSEVLDQSWGLGNVFEPGSQVSVGGSEFSVQESSISEDNSEVQSNISNGQRISDQKFGSVQGGVQKSSQLGEGLSGVLDISLRWVSISPELQVKWANSWENLSSDEIDPLINLGLLESSRSVDILSSSLGDISQNGISLIDESVWGFQNWDLSEWVSGLVLGGLQISIIDVLKGEFSSNDLSGSQNGVSSVVSESSVQNQSHCLQFLI